MGNYLFADPSFLAGVGRVLDLGGAFDDYNASPTEALADARAMRADWVAVGRDLQAAMDSPPDGVPSAPAA